MWHSKHRIHDCIEWLHNPGFSIQLSTPTAGSQIDSLLDTDPIGCETFSMIRIRINHSGSGSEQLRI
jgi:hypothetical protein